MLFASFWTLSWVSAIINVRPSVSVQLSLLGLLFGILSVQLATALLFLCTLGAAVIIMTWLCYTLLVCSIKQKERETAINHRINQCRFLLVVALILNMAEGREVTFLIILCGMGGTRYLWLCTFVSSPSFFHFCVCPTYHCSFNCGQILCLWLS